jgi:3-mercaptopyruvate sulfurtransferase SseA
MKYPLSALSLVLAVLTIGAPLHAGAADLPEDVVAAQSSSVSADAAHAALVRGAMAVDVRSGADYQRGHLPGAVSAPELAAASSLRELEALVSRHGVDLSREVVIVGHPGDVHAQRLQALMASYATGRVTWLVGGVNEWTLSGRPVDQQAAVLPPVPQYLVPLQPQPPAPRMAGANLRDLGQIRPVVATAF